LLNIEKNGSELKEKLDRKESLRPAMLKKHKQLQEELNNAKDWLEKKNTLVDVRTKLVWSYVVENERAIAKIESEIAKCHEALGKADEKLEFYLKEKGMLDTNREGVDKTVEVLTNEMNAFNVDIKKLEAKRNASNKEAQKYNNTLKANESTLKALTNRRSKFEENLKGVKDNQDEEIRKAQLKKDNQIASFEKKIAEKEERMNTVKVELEKYNAASENVGRQQKEIEQKQQSCKRDIDDLTKNLSNFTKQLQNRSLAFGQDTETIVKLLNSSGRRFEKVPIGPIGLRISIPDSKWVKGCETCIGPLLQTYLVHSSKDEEEFFKLLSEKNIRTERLRVIRQPFRTEQYTNLPSMPEGSVTVLSKINSDHPHIKNILADHAKAERCVLVDDKNQAMNLLNQRNPNRGVYSSIVDVSGMQYSLTPNGGGIVSDPSNLDRPTTLADTQSQMQTYSARLKEKEKEMTALKSEMLKLTPKMQEASVERDKSRKLLATLARAVDEYNEEINTIQNEPLPADQTESKRSWEASIEEINKDINVALEEKKKTEELMKEARKGLEPFDEQINELKRQLEEKMKEVDEGEEQIKKVAGYYEKLKMKQTQVHEAKANINNLLATKEGELKAKKGENDAKVKELEAQGKPRVELKKTETPSFLIAQANQLQKQLEEQKNHRDIAVIHPEYVASKEKLNAMDEELTIYKTLYHKSVNSLTKRKELYMKLVYELSKRLKYKFRQNLQHKGFQGQLLIDHTTKTLEINVVPNNKALQTDTSQLSGGERSFSTVSLLMAMWEVMENSLCAMDEFDVFMDMSSRQKSIEMLVEMSLANKKRQFIFISPQSMQGVPVNSQIQLIVVADPKRV
jgi:chromosome segregation ATPase